MLGVLLRGRVYGSKYSTKAKECDVETVQKSLEDKLCSQTQYSLCPYLQ